MENSEAIDDNVSGASPICPASRSLDTQPLCRVDGFEIWRCPESATDFVWPMPDDAVLKELYDREAWFEGGERGGYADYDAQTAPSLHLVEELLQRFPADKGRLTILDVGCGYGTHLRLAADRGWKCFGIEPSAHGREVAGERHGERMSIVERAEDILPQRFDLILMLEVIEHLKDPYPLFYTLFGRDAIGPDTLVVITTPNARSNEAVADPGAWAYRHPPSHLVFYSARSLEILLHRLMFKNVSIRGLVPLPQNAACRYEDEQFSRNDDLREFLGVAAEASGSAFHEFMRERYVPGSYWRLTEYEHLPRYSLATTLARGERVLDFGCGTGYGSAALAEVAQSVVGLDIAADAIEWARQMHRSPRLEFACRSDLGRGLAPASFDLVTCFEMIEHVNHETQVETIRNIAILLKPAGKLVISTPDPQYTAPYGDNPYHLREMTEAEFLELLQPHFRHVTMLRQWVRPAVLIGRQSIPGAEPVLFSQLNKTGSSDSLVGFVAICSNQAFDTPPHFCQFDTALDFNRQTLENEHRLNRLRFENIKLTEGKEWFETQVRGLKEQVAERDQTLAETREWLKTHVQALEDQVAERDRALSENREWLKAQVEALEKQLSSSIQAPEELKSGNALLLDQRSYWERASAVGVDEIIRCHASLEGLLSSRLFRLLVRAKLLNLKHVPPGSKVSG